MKMPKIDNHISLRALQKTVLPVLAVALVVLFIYSSSAITLFLGLSSADDGYFALAAKSLAMGVYGLPMSSFEVSHFEPAIGSGPVLIGLGALVTYLIGPTDYLGLSIILLFASQIFIAAWLLGREFGLESVSGFVFVALFLLILVSRNHWYFSIFIGEAPALGFVLVGAALLSNTEQRSRLLLAGVSFAAAYLSKQIALFAIIGIMLAWFLSDMQNSGRRTTFRKCGFLGAAFAIPPLVFELAKLASLGFDGYRELWKRTAQITTKFATGKIDNRLEVFFDVLSESYALDIMSTLILLGFCTLLVRQILRKNSNLFSLMLASGAVSYLAYIVSLSTMWPRYFWIGLGLVAFASGATLLRSSDRLKWAVLGILVLVLGIPVFSSILNVVGLHADYHLSEERRKVLSGLSNTSEPIVGRSWHSFYDIVYLVDRNRIWVTEKDIDLINHQPFVAVLNSAFGDKERFFTSVTGSCKLTFNGKRYSLYSCEDQFWDEYTVQ